MSDLATNTSPLVNDTAMGVMVALLPTTSDWCSIDLPHMTLVFAGDVDTLKETDHNELAKTAMKLAMTSPIVTTDVLATDLFGDDNDTEVLLLRPTPLILAMRAQLESWNASQFPFTPHVTVGPRGSFSIIPSTITFDRVCVQWGLDCLEFKLQDGW